MPVRDSPERCIITGMQLVGLLDSPFVRRVAVSLLTLGVPFEHRPVSVFRGFDAFQALNPVVKAPTLLADDGSALMDSSLILQYVEQVAGRGSLLPSEPAALLRALRRIGLALAACEKTAQIVYERGLRPPEKQHQPWIDRVSGQLVAAFTGLEHELDAAPLEAASARALGQSGISMAVAWHFTQQMLPQVVPAAGFPRLVALSAAAESLAEFRAAPYGEGSVSALA